jgi:hypothetical protein
MTNQSWPGATRIGTAASASGTKDFVLIGFEEWNSERLSQ